ncbi:MULTISPECIES: DUF3237 domain-containing protein [Parvibaculaceae]|jgi:hypothetical protein|uniref:UPF0311 protein BN1012_Phect2948 n=1 Tax=Candidatus Phaeomarinibacter ectocarpi TaxID=1458461 RepID=X5MNC7_9HYPH|nr:DUF3237 domain-containing protein [Candidatus Phaeomarinobacter ectocarpi]MDW3099714.1 DUF3237 domain-containing protein [Alphaproteobacteria bacterium]CDO61160.1 hypothetical protein BN1012_Phect2948 [Candidatus Phaeomarinobacter ectocarpi]
MVAALKSEFLCSMAASLDASLPVGAGPIGNRMVAYVASGTVEGDKLKGEILPGGGDWALVRQDGCLVIDVRICIKTHDGAIIYVTYGGRMDIPADLQPKVFNPQTAESVDPADYYFRTCPLFETGDERYAWLNRIQAVGVGRLTSTGVSYDVHQIL